MDYVHLLSLIYLTLKSWYCKHTRTKLLNFYFIMPRKVQVSLDSAYAHFAVALQFSDFICVGIPRSRKYRNMVTVKKCVMFTIKVNRAD